MNWGAVGAITSVACAIAALVSGYSTLSLKAAMEKLRADLAESRAKDREELIKYLNGSFMRSREAIERMRALEERIEWLPCRAHPKDGCVK